MQNPSGVSLIMSRPEQPNFEDIHASIFPADVRVNDRILARLKLRDGASYVDVRVWRLSPLGVEILDPGPEHGFARGAAIDLELVIAGQRTSFEGLVVDQVVQSNRVNLIGIRFSRQTEASEVGTERRRSKRWLCSDEFLPTCVAPAPGRFDEYMYFQIRDISQDGLQLSCSLRNKFLIPGMRLHLTAVFPMGSVVTLRVEIVRVGVTSMAGEDKLTVGTLFRDLSALGRRAIGQYLIQFSDAETLEQLRGVGFAPESMAQGTTYYCLKTEEDYRAVLELRFLANQKAGQIGAIRSPEETGDMHDARSRILVAKRNGKVIGTTRFRYTQLDEPLEAEAYVKWPSHFPRRDQIFEMSRLATHPDYRGSDLLPGLFRFGCTTCVDADRPWLVMSSMDKYVGFYRKVGFRPTGLSYEDPLWSGRLNVMMVNYFDMIKGKGVHPAYWNEIWRDVAELAIRDGLVSLDGMDRARIFFYKALRPVTRLMMKLMKR